MSGVVPPFRGEIGVRHSDMSVFNFNLGYMPTQRYSYNEILVPIQKSTVYQREGEFLAACEITYPSHHVLTVRNGGLRFNKEEPNGDYTLMTIIFPPNLDNISSTMRCAMSVYQVKQLLPDLLPAVLIDGHEFKLGNSMAGGATKPLSITFPAPNAFIATGVVYRTESEFEYEFKVHNAVFDSAICEAYFTVPGGEKTRFVESLWDVSATPQRYYRIRSKEGVTTPPVEVGTEIELSCKQIYPLDQPDFWESKIVTGFYLTIQPKIWMSQSATGYIKPVDKSPYQVEFDDLEEETSEVNGVTVATYAISAIITITTLAALLF